MYSWSFELIKMRSIFICMFVLGISVNAKVYRFNEKNMPIKVVETSKGQGGQERIIHLNADIKPSHRRSNDRVNFPRSGKIEKYFKAIKADGDERGHLVASQFSGPPQWYNLSPQNARVNRNAGYQSLTTDWYGTECEVSKFLSQGGNRHVSWTVDMTYILDSNRPDEYHLQVDFFNGNKKLKSIDSLIRNPFKKEDSTFWICRTCRTNGSPDCTHA